MTYDLLRVKLVNFTKYCHKNVNKAKKTNTLKKDFIQIFPARTLLAEKERLWTLVEDKETFSR